MADTLRRGALGYIRNRKTEEKNHPKPQNRKKIRPKPKAEYKTVKNRCNGDKWDTRGGHLGIFWVGMCRPGLQIGTPF